ncbi:MAG: VWA domain-containing protein [Caldilinea sp.]|nr:VWA domain-containing protein [Caldilinea sp.]MCB0150147.1 VWA domain-containing protein [Caldilineaceae bacterium]MCB9140668.1 VWA domain-containing protein [Anaerolineales bacterium]MCB9114757.1 VWA domain-containing protein [Caldilineaceae bacterium]MCB9120381.1 VWA domain-containing protein [Caldilineaceae bacterium]
MTDSFVLSTTLNTALLPGDHAPRLLYVLLEITPNTQAPLRRTPVNLALVVDASESMLIPSLDDELVEELDRRGLLVETIADGVPVFRVLDMPDDLAARAEPICTMDFVQQALRLLVERLGADDRVALVAFAASAKTLVSNRSGADRRKMLDVLETLVDGRLGDDTLLTAGLQAALSEAQRGQGDDRQTRLLLLTDGFVADEERAKGVAAQVASSGFPLSTVGLGMTFNEGFLIDLAEMSGGNAHLVFRPAEIPGIFAAELESAQRIVARAVDMRIGLTPGVEIRRVHRIHPVISELPLSGLQDRSLTLSLGALEREQPLAVLVELLCPPRPPGAYRLAQVVVTGDAPGSPPVRTMQRTDILVQVAPPGQPLPVPDVRVMKLVETVNTFKLQTRALADAAAGDIAGATRKLQTAATRLLADGEFELAAAVQSEITNLEQQGELSAAGAKKLRYDTRKLTQKLA